MGDLQNRLGIGFQLSEQLLETLNANESPRSFPLIDPVSNKRVGTIVISDETPNESSDVPLSSRKRHSNVISDSSNENSFVSKKRAFKVKAKCVISLEPETKTLPQTDSQIETLPQTESQSETLPQIEPQTETVSPKTPQIETVSPKKRQGESNRGRKRRSETFARNKQGRFLCPKCPINFSLLKDAKRHVNSIHTLVKYTCHVCEKEFKRQDYLHDHQVRKHPRQKTVQSVGTSQNLNINMMD